MSILVEHFLVPTALHVIVDYFNHSNQRYKYAIEYVGGCLGNSNATLSDVGKQIQKTEEATEERGLLRAEPCVQVTVRR